MFESCPNILVLTHHSSPHTTLALLSDLRSSAPKTVKAEDAQDVAKRHGMRYVETSSLKQEGLKECFDAAVSRIFLGLKFTHTHTHTVISLYFVL